MGMGNDHLASIDDIAAELRAACIAAGIDPDDTEADDMTRRATIAEADLANARPPFTENEIRRHYRPCA